MIRFKSSSKENIQKQLRIFAAITFLVSGFLAKPVEAFNPTLFGQLASIKSATTEPMLMAKSGWKNFSSSRGNFAVLFPGKPTRQRKKHDDGFVSYAFTLKSDSGYYLLSYFDMPAQAKLPAPNEIKSILEILPDTFMKEFGGKLLDKQSISLHGYPGEEFEFSYQDFITGKGRIYLVKRRTYMVMALTNSSENAQKFLDSFRLLKNPPLSPLGAR